MDVVNYLIANNINVNFTNENGDTPLMLVVRKGYLQIINILLAAGADVNHANQ